MPKIKQTIAKNIKNIRKAKHLTQEQLAHKVGVNLRQLARIEAGQSFASADTLEKICVALDIVAKDLFDENFSEHSNSSKKVFQLIENIKDIADDDKKVAFLNSVVVFLAEKQ